MPEQPTKKEYNRQRGNQIIIRFSDEELAELNEKIAQSGLSKTDFFLQILRQGNIIVLSDLKEICIELKRQGINLNQAMRYYHETGVEEEIREAIYNCNENYEKMKNLFILTENRIQKARKKKFTGQEKGNKMPDENESATGNTEEETKAGEE